MAARDAFEEGDSSAGGVRPANVCAATLDLEARSARDACAFCCSRCRRRFVLVVVVGPPVRWPCCFCSWTLRRGVMVSLEVPAQRYILKCAIV